MVTRIGENKVIDDKGRRRGPWEMEKLSLQQERQGVRRMYEAGSGGASQLLHAPPGPDEPGARPSGAEQQEHIGKLNTRLRRIDEALHRIVTGRYGLCPSCGIEISRDRLEQDLATKYCLLCQAESDTEDPRETPSDPL